MICDWPLVKLGDHIDSCLGKMLDKSKNKGTLQPYLGNSNVQWGQFVLSDLAEMKFEPDEEERYSIIPGDLVICEGGEPGRCAVWEGQVARMKIQKALHRVRPKGSFDNYFLYYWLSHAGRTGQLEPYFTGSTIKHLTGKALKSLEVPMPPIDVQSEIAGVLKLLDDKIANNRALAADLEAMARAIFKSWFVDFDPVTAKMEGGAPAGMDADTAALFPNELVESVLGLIPKGWAPCTFSSIIDIWSGGTPKTKIDEYWGGDIPWFSVVDAPAPGEVFVIGTEKTITQDGLAYSPTKILPLGSTIVSARGTVGRTAVVCGPMTMNQSCYALKGHLGDWFTYLSITRQIDWLKHHAHGGVFDTITRSTFDGLQICRPDRRCVEQFETLVTPLFRRIEQLTRESANLAALRDILLPRLISGKLCMPETHVGLAESVL